MTANLKAPMLKISLFIKTKNFQLFTFTKAKTSKHKNDKMKIRAVITLITLMLWSFQMTKAQSFSPQEESAIDMRVNRFLNTIEQRDYTSLLDFIYPPIFEHTSKESMFQFFNLLEKAGIALKFNNLEVKEKLQWKR